MGEPSDLEGDLASSWEILRNGDDGPHLLELCFKKMFPPSSSSRRVGTVTSDGRGGVKLMGFAVFRSYGAFKSNP